VSLYKIATPAGQGPSEFPERSKYRPARPISFFMRLEEVSIACRMRDGEEPAALALEIGVKRARLDLIASRFSEIPDAALATLRQLLRERQKLRALVSRMAN